MSYDEFRRRIDIARQILVGAVPSPAGQIDQITYALMYKFMNDIDDQSGALGGMRTYFINEFERYNWHALMSPALEAHERLDLYRQAIQGMAKNSNIPPLFREIYQNAFLPFNSPSVLTLFLSEIDKFNHGDSDDIGDAYEYLLSITGAQGDVGQFRTPRHIIKFIVDAVDPTKTDTVLDPAVGTAGFLIAAYGHVTSQDNQADHQLTNKDGHLTSDELGKIHANYRGFDIDPTMVRTASVNMYLHGFTSPDIRNHDSLSSEDYWNDKYDVILANPPFMSPKGGIQPHKKFGISANRAEVLFVDYIASHLKPNGRAGIIVPEGIIFQNGKAYKELRKNLVENYLYAVISLPAGVFQPYSGVKTSVLLFDKKLARERDEIMLLKIENDGYSLGSQRRKIADSQFPEALELIEQYKKGEMVTPSFGVLVPRAKILATGDYSLSSGRYQEVDIYNHQEYPVVPLSELVTIATGKKDVNQGNPEGIFPFFTCAKEYTYSDSFSYDMEALLIAGNGDVGNVKYYRGKFEVYQRTYILSNFKNVEPLYLFYILDNTLKPTLNKLKLGNTMPYIKLEMLANYTVPLPPIELQRQIVTEILSYQRMIDAADIIVKNYQPTIKVEPSWETLPFRDVATLEYGKALTARDRVPGEYPVLGSNGVSGYHNDYLVRGPGIVVGRKGSAGEITWVDSNFFPIDTTYFIKPVRELNMKFLFFELLHMELQKLKNGAGIPGLNREDVYTSKTFAMPNLKTQNEIIAEIEAELALINSNKKLIYIYQQKIKAKISEIWGE